ncbi:MAG: zinc metalloprotease HtpX [Candidatus Niyogibacteria bacterium CG10_big_fil_rev_8_21_14_0_10_46_36]|uniref:Protease HtpX homolog n=1 Tax=Candidatus Niyogibacteria bacterium CG10_big_fil_rev_8_21_14_0_10_46_36 TaxID=1974726 RepID=A0A2H0TCF0_9BACT|nr:MAG: zinc metalloprotease HtpX [Candidatus Niyogibacteria bacterium CG10_big_fil_rev_8_21_14_0_10_46_36]
MASLYTHKDSNIRKTWLLFAVFFVVVIGVGWAFSYIYGNQAILVIAVLFSVFMSLFSYWYSDKIVLRLTRAKKVEKKDNPELYNIVENLAITAGLPMPRVYVVDESVPNAFATGRDPEHAVVAVTEGLLRILDRSELEGVLAHELSHVGNRDMLVSTIVVVLVGFLALLSDMFLRSLFWGSLNGGRDRRGGGGVIILIGVMLAILSPIVASLIQLAISRKREYLADASGALLTRYPEGLASALEKIGKHSAPMKSANNATAHLWLSDPHGKRPGFMSRMFMTHPPLEDRVARLRGMNM